MRSLATQPLTSGRFCTYGRVSSFEGMERAGGRKAGLGRRTWQPACGQPARRLPGLPAPPRTHLQPAQRVQAAGAHNAGNLHPSAPAPQLQALRRAQAAELRIPQPHRQLLDYRQRTCRRCSVYRWQNCTISTGMASLEPPRPETSLESSTMQTNLSDAISTICARAVEGGVGVA